MRVNIIHMGFFYKGGGEKVVVEQTKRLRSRGHQVKVFSPIIYLDRTYPEVREIMARRLVPSLPFPFPFRESSAMLASAILPFGVKSMRECDVLLCHSQPSLWIGFRMNQLYGIPYVGYLHQLTTFVHSRPNVAGNWNTGDFALLETLIGRGFLNPVIKAFDRLSHRRASALLFNSIHTRSLFRTAYGVDGTVCYPGLTQPGRISVERRDNELLMSARQYPWKRIDLALQVLKKLQVRREIRLIVTGTKTELSTRLAELAGYLGVSEKVSFDGEVSPERLIQLYSEAAVYMQTSIHEPFGMSSLEAQSYGTPAVVWGDAGLKETVIDGKTGFYARPYDVEDFAAKVSLLLEDKELRAKFSKEAFAWVMSPQFSWQSHLDTVEETLKEAMK